MAGPLALLLVTIVGLGAVFWGYFNPPDIRVIQFDAGPVAQWHAQRIVGFPDKKVYVVALDDGRLRALDTRIEASGCVAQWRPDDPRGAAKNPAGLPGVFEDICGGGVWSMVGDAISGSDKPLRTPLVDTRPDTQGKELRVWVELINPDK
ncbi:MAG: hypothetical protein EXR68_03155 [Dehalococcoidia bacterium]|nr:hypothetical protein [Dehalococcoidia bacterium]